MIFAIVNQKGGTGKTTTTVNLGSGLAKLGKKVLMIDLDPQGSLSYSVGIMEPPKTMSDVLLSQVGLEEVLLEREGMKVAPSNISLADVELSLSTHQKREHVLKSKLLKVNSFDFVLIDCPPSLSLLTVNALTAADEIIVPMQMEVLSLQGLDLILNSAERIKNSLNKNLLVKGLLPVMVNTRRKLSTEIHDYINENYQLNIFDTRIHADVRISEAPSFGRSVLKYSPRSRGAQEYINFAHEIIKTS